MQRHGDFGSKKREGDDRRPAQAAPPRAKLRTQLLAAGRRFTADPAAFASADAALAHHLETLIMRLVPSVLGLYWPRASEFNVRALIPVDAAGRRSLPFSLALPHTRRTPPQLDYRRWDGSTPRALDEHGIPASDGPIVVPDAVLVPCVGFTRDGYRLGYGGGYFDRWLGERRGVAAVGVAWALAEIGAADFAPEAHDVPLTWIVTEHGVVG